MAFANAEDRRDLEASRLGGVTILGLAAGCLGGVTILGLAASRFGGVMWVRSAATAASRVRAVVK